MRQIQNGKFNEHGIIRITGGHLKNRVERGTIQQEKWKRTEIGKFKHSLRSDRENSNGNGIAHEQQDHQNSTLREIDMEANRGI